MFKFLDSLLLLILIVQINGYLYKFRKSRKGPWISSKRVKVELPNNKHKSVWPCPPINNTIKKNNSNFSNNTNNTNNV